MMTDRAIAEIEHEIIERAKESFKEDDSLPFIRHLEIAAQDLARGYWHETYMSRGVWHLRVEPVKPGYTSDQGGLL